MATDQFDNFQLNPNDLGSDWVFSGDEVHGKRSPSGKIANYNYYFVGTRMSQDRTRTVLSFASKGNSENPMKGWAGHNWSLTDGYGGHGVDWSVFNYNPYGKQDVWNSSINQNPNFRVTNDWLKITGMGGIDVVTDDVMTKDEVEASGMVQYRNYPTEGWSSFGKKGDKRWKWQGNSWVPGN